jgi:hypothetical protein
VKKTSIAIILILCLLGAVAAWAVNEYVISPHKIVEVEEYILTLDVNTTRCKVRETIMLTGTFSYTNSTGDYDMTYATIQLYCNNAFVESTQTDDSGAYTFLYVPQIVGTYDFYANATIT